MRNLFTYVGYFFFAISLLFSRVSFAQNQWIDRAFAYANRFYDGEHNWNPEYGYESDENGDYANDCANFGSQIVNAGCGGLCEWNNTNWSEWHGGDCDSYYNPWSDNCYYCPDPLHLHYIIPSAHNLELWFWDMQNTDWPYGAYIYANGVIPDWVGEGNFCITETSSGQYHVAFVGQGYTGPNARYWAHTADRHGEYTVTQLLHGSGVIGMYIISSGASPFDELDSLITDFATEAKTEFNERGTK